MAEPVVAGAPPAEGEAEGSRKEKRKAAKKLKRKQARVQAAIREREEEEARANDPEEQLRIRIREQDEAEATERERRMFEERERLWLEAAALRKAEEEEERRRLREESQKECEEFGHGNVLEEDDDWEYVEEGPAEIIWQGNEIIVKKKKVRVPKQRASKQENKQEEDERPISNPLPPQSEAFASYMHTPAISAQEVLESVSQQIPNFGTEQDKTHCPFHLKTGACRFGSRCSRVHFHPDTSSTLLMKNMYNGPGLAWEQDEGLEYTDEEVEHAYEEFYEDVHTEFLKFGEPINFKVCRNGSYHLRGNVYVHYKTLESAILAFNTMNGRYFAGKQITCEFVGVTRWRIAICGEFMKSRLKNCSRGTACNFIHCFRNPGGDYEWADWDNPPPKYWIRKMSALFGPSEEAGYEKQMELENQERSRSSSRKRTPLENRYASTRSDRNELANRHYGYGREDLDGTKEQCYTGLSKREHSIRNTKEKPLLDKHKHHKEKRKSSTSNYSVRHHSHGRHSGEGNATEMERHSIDENHKLTSHGYSVERNLRDRYYGEGNYSRESGTGSVKEHRDKYGFEDEDRHKQKPRSSEDLSRRHRKKKDTLEVQPKSNKYDEELSSPDQLGSTRYCGDQNNSHSIGKSFARKIIDDQDRYDGRYCFDNVDSDKESSDYESRLLHRDCSNDEQAYDNHAHERDDNGKSLRRDGSKLRYSSDESPDSRQSYNCTRSSHAFSRHSGSEEPGNSSENSEHGKHKHRRRHSTSGKKRRHHHDSAEYEDSEETRHDKIHSGSSRKRRHHGIRDEHINQESKHSDTKNLAYMEEGRRRADSRSQSPVSLSGRNKTSTE